jgi:hypothetical protein
MAANYGALPKGSDEFSDTFFGLECTSQRMFMVSYILSLLTYIITLSTFNVGMYNYENILVWLLLIKIVLCINGMSRNTHHLDLTTGTASAWARPIALGSLVACILGSVAGIFCYDAYGYFSMIYANSRSYANTVPSQPAASVADAGRMTFAKEAFVDQTHASGYSAPNDVTYCVAPIRDMVETSHVEFWAVGYDCCGWSGSFQCDASEDAEARGGIVVFDNPGYLVTSNKDYYDFARKKAEASYDLVSAKKPLYVRWVANENLDMMQKFYQGRVAAFIILTSLLYAFLSAPFAYIGSIAHYKSYFKLN